MNKFCSNTKFFVQLKISNIKIFDFNDPKIQTDLKRNVSGLNLYLETPKFEKIASLEVYLNDEGMGHSKIYDCAVIKTIGDESLSLKMESQPKLLNHQLLLVNVPYLYNKKTAFYLVKEDITLIFEIRLKIENHDPNKSYRYVLLILLISSLDIYEGSLTIKSIDLENYKIFHNTEMNKPLEFSKHFTEIVHSINSQLGNQMPNQFQNLSIIYNFNYSVLIDKSKTLLYSDQIFEQNVSLSFLTEKYWQVNLGSRHLSTRLIFKSESNIYTKKNWTGVERDKCAFERCIKIKRGECFELDPIQNNSYNIECKCKQNYFGRRCQYWGRCNNCQNKFCSHGNKCLLCRNGYRGKDCDKISCRQIDMCKNGGTCFIFNEKRRCKCLLGYIGKYCEWECKAICDINICSHLKIKIIIENNKTTCKAMRSNNNFLRVALIQLFMVVFLFLVMILLQILIWNLAPFIKYCRTKYITKQGESFNSKVLAYKENSKLLFSKTNTSNSFSKTKITNSSSTLIDSDIQFYQQSNELIDENYYISLFYYQE